MFTYEKKFFLSTKIFDTQIINILILVKFLLKFVEISQFLYNTCWNVRNFRDSRAETCQEFQEKKVLSTRAVRVPENKNSARL